MSGAMQGRNWVFTINNPESNDLPNSFGGKYAVWQLEKGEKGTLHLQGYICFEKNMRLNALKQLHGTAHWELRRGNHKQAKAYATKDDTRQEGPWEVGTEPSQGKRSDLDSLKETIDSGASMLEIAEGHFGSFLKYEKGILSYKRLKCADRNWKTEVTLLYGPTGTGKSYAAKHAYPDAYWLTRPTNGNTLWFDGYDEHETIVIDEFYGWMIFDFVLRLFDETPLLCQIKGGSVRMVAKRIIVTSNKYWKEWYPNVGLNHTNALDRRIENIIFLHKRGEYVIERKNKTDVREVTSGDFNLLNY